MVKDIHGNDVDINMTAEIKAALEAGTDLKTFAVGMAKKHEVYVSGATWNRVKQIQNGNTKEQRYQRRIKELEDQLAGKKGK